jgi:3'-phosphoadenosine 5'-phosphosulfate sulfotransferase (PAPS reductase)/FAD synthetase
VPGAPRVARIPRSAEYAGSSRRKRDRRCHWSGGRTDNTRRFAELQPSHLGRRESEAVHVLREVAAGFERPVLLFSGGKDSIVLLRLAEKAFRPARFPFPLMHVDTGENFPEAIEFRDRRVAELGEPLLVASMQDSIDRGRVVEETGPRASRNRLQPTTLLDALGEQRFDCAIGGARRDEDRARAKERIFSFRDDFGPWDPKAQRSELWNIYNTAIHPGEHVRVFPLSNWTELDVWEYMPRVARGALDLLRPRAIGLQPRRHALRLPRGPGTATRRDGHNRDGPLPDRRRHELHRRRALDRSHDPRDRCRDRDHPAHGARPDPRRRSHDGQRDGRPQESRLLLMSRTELETSRRPPVDANRSPLRVSSAPTICRSACCASLTPALPARCGEAVAAEPTFATGLSVCA